MLDSGKPLWLPTGSVRAIIALAITFAYISMTAVGVKVDPINDSFLLLIGFYFGQKSQPTT